MFAAVQPINVEVHEIKHEAPPAGERLKVTVHFSVKSPYGVLQIAIPVEDAISMDWAVQQARERLAEWAASVARNARG